MKKFKNGMSIVQLEERYEMTTSGDRSRNNDIIIEVGPDSISAGVRFNL